MKTERRHELQTNVLASSLAVWVDKVRPYSRVGLAAVIALAAVMFAWGYYANQSAQRQADGWDEYFNALDDRDARVGLSDVVDRYAGTPVGLWARVVLADIQLADGTNRMFVDKAAAREELQKVVEAYQALLLESDQPMLKQRATFGLARAREALGKDLAKARQEYRSIAETWPESPYAAAATARASDLDRLETKNFYDWFAKYEPPRPMAREPGIPGVRPEFMKDQLDDTGLSLPSGEGQPILPSLTTEPAGSAPAESAPAAAAEGSASPSPDKPAGEQPVEAPAAKNEPAPAAEPPQAEPSGEQPK